MLNWEEINRRLIEHFDDVYKWNGEKMEVVLLKIADKLDEYKIELERLKANE